MNTKELIANYKNGSLAPILDAMYNDGQWLENEIVSEIGFASYATGRLVGGFGRYQAPGLSYIDRYLHISKDTMLVASLIKPDFVMELCKRDVHDQKVYAYILTVTEQAMDMPLFLVGLFVEHRLKERKELGAKIKKLRIEAGLTQEQLAEKTNMKQQAIERVEAGRFSVGQDILSTISLVLGKKIELV